MSDIEKAKNTEPAARDFFDAYSDYGDQVLSQYIKGRHLKYKKGSWVYGPLKEEVDLPLGTKMIAVMPSIRVGWTKWEDGKPVGDKTGYLEEGFRPIDKEDRATLGDTDESTWAEDDKGRKRDPWQPAHYLVVVAEDGEIYTYTTGSDGGTKACGKLCKLYGPRQHGDEFPIVTLGSDSYKHADRTRGTIYVPILEVVGWTAKEPVLAQVKAYTDGGGEPAAEAKPARKKIVAPAKKAAAPAKGGKSPNF